MHYDVRVAAEACLLLDGTVQGCNHIKTAAHERCSVTIWVFDAISRGVMTQVLVHWSNA